MVNDSEKISQAKNPRESIVREGARAWDARRFGRPIESAAGARLSRHQT